MKVSLHTARAFLRTFQLRNVPLLDKSDASGRRIVIRSGNLAILVCGRFRCAPLGDSSGTHQATGVARHLLFPVGGGSTYSLAIQDQTDVGISGALQPGLSFFGHLNAVSATLPCGWGGHEQRGPDEQRFHVLHSLRDGFRSALYTGSLPGQRRVTLESPNQTACPFGLSLKQPLVAHSW